MKVKRKNVCLVYVIFSYVNNGQAFDIHFMSISVNVVIIQVPISKVFKTYFKKILKV